MTILPNISSIMWFRHPATLSRKGRAGDNYRYYQPEWFHYSHDCEGIGAHGMGHERCQARKHAEADPPYKIILCVPIGPQCNNKDPVQQIEKRSESQKPGLY